MKITVVRIRKSSNVTFPRLEFYVYLSIIWMPFEKRGHLYTRFYAIPFHFYLSDASCKLEPPPRKI